MSVKFRRLGATFIDCICIHYIIYFFGLIMEPLIKDNIYIRLCLSITLLIFDVLVFLRKDVIFGYESIGKKIMKLKIYDIDGNRLTDKKLLIDRVRHSLWPFCLYPFMILIDNRSVGDKKMKTRVE